MYTKSCTIQSCTLFQPEDKNDSNNSSDENEGADETRSLVQQQNRKNKKSGGFQAMGE